MRLDTEVILKQNKEDTTTKMPWKELPGREESGEKRGAALDGTQRMSALEDHFPGCARQEAPVREWSCVE